MTQLQDLPLSISSDIQRRALNRKPRLSGPQVTAILCIMPALLIFLVFVVWPILQSARYSFYDWNGLGPLKKYVALENYEKLLTDPVFWKALGNNIVLVVWSLVTQIPLAIFLAIILTRKIKGTALFRTLFFVPFVLSDVIIATLWTWIYRPTLGLANAFLNSIGIASQGWLGNPGTALLCVLIVATWKYLGFHTVIYIAAIQGIPEELYEAARIDGANEWQLHRHITVPSVLTTIRIDAVLIIIGSLKAFDLFWVLTEGGPSHSSELIATYMYREAFRATDWSYGSTLAFALFVIAFAFALLFMFITRRRAETA
jgi:raffinose/stachyose/melibiose transport system permease protein